MGNRQKIIGLILVGTFCVIGAFALGIISHPDNSVNIGAIKAQLTQIENQYSVLATQKVKDQLVATQAQQVVDNESQQLLLLHGEAERLRDQISLAMVQQGKQAGAQ